MGQENPALQICSVNEQVTYCSEASLVIAGLYQGSRPPVGADLQGFSLLVLCAKEWQPRAHLFNVPETFHCPLDDAGWRSLEMIEVESILHCARTVAKYLKADKKVLVTCAMGWNRSGVVSAMAIRIAYGLPAEHAIALVRKARGQNALSNGSFVRLIERTTV